MPGHRTTHVSITPGDSGEGASNGEIPYNIDYLWVGVGGDLALEDKDGTAITYSNVPSGTEVWGSFTRVNDTNTDASNIVAVGSAF